MLEQELGKYMNGMWHLVDLYLRLMAQWERSITKKLELMPLTIVSMVLRV